MTGSAHAKIILIGEHSVVYGHKAMAMPLFELTTETTLLKSQENYVESALFSGKTKDAPPTLEPLKELIDSLQETYGLSPHLHTVQSTIPIGAGFGSSAALAASIVRAYRSAYDLNINEEKLFEWVQFFEKLTHVNPSGIDALSVIHDTPWVFSKEEKSPLQMTLQSYLVIADTLERTPTRESVANVARQKSEAFFTPTLNLLAAASEKAIDTITQKDVATLGILMDRFMDGLRQLGLSTDTIETYIRTAREYGALGAKLTGGGMGGCVIALAPTRVKAKAIANALEKNHGAPVWISRL